MPSFQLTITPSRRAATRFINDVRRSIQKALIEERRISGLTQSEIARRIGVHRSVINREIRGQKDLMLGRVAELAYALGRETFFEMRTPEIADETNAPPVQPPRDDTGPREPAYNWGLSDEDKVPTKTSGANILDISTAI